MSKLRTKAKTSIECSPAAGAADRLRATVAALITVLLGREPDAASLAESTGKEFAWL
ncbi:hypothetical protein [Hydrogenophaga sp. 5NK40-0174]|uniref:hypothetical protein n=1 Tax=Hydrogenophaga sp. 5NK40-0174 TaxID=3127649 RepID=UPI003342084D